MTKKAPQTNAKAPPLNEMDRLLSVCGQVPLKRLMRVYEVALKFRDAHEKRWARTRAMQDLAAEARRTGQSLGHRIPEIERQHPVVWDLGNLVDELCRALGPKR